MPFKLKSFAKINLILEVLARRSDGFHEVETVLQQLELHDIICFEELPKGRMEFICDDPELPMGEENLVCKAAQLLKKIVPRKGAKIVLHKRIPVAAGLGGGSSNAATVLLGLKKLWNLPLEEALLFQLAARLGSDVPFFIWGGTALAKGRGEVIYSLPAFPAVKVLLAIPRDLQLTAGEVYSSLVMDKITRKAATNDFIRFLKEGSKGYRHLVELLHNDLEMGLLYEKRVSDLKHKFRQKKLPALLSGSGPTVFALSPDEQELLNLGKELEGEGYRTFLTATEQPSEHIMPEGKKGGDL